MTTRFSLGPFVCTSIMDGHGTQIPKVLFGDVPLAELTFVVEPYDVPTDTIPTWYNVLLLEDDQHKILIDTGFGPQPDDPTRGLTSGVLAALDIAPEMITHVIITHAHPDHIGGTVNALDQAAYPNAHYIISQPEWDHWTTSPVKDTERGANISRRLLLLEDRYERVEPNQQLLPGITALHTPGHTPGHMALLIADQLIHVGDAILKRMHCRRPDWSPLFDDDRSQSAQTRRKLMKRISDDELLMFAYHFPPPALGRLEDVDPEWLWHPVDIEQLPPQTA